MEVGTMPIYHVDVIERRLYKAVYVVEAANKREAKAKAKAGDIVYSLVVGFVGWDGVRLNQDGTVEKSSD